MNEKEIDDFIKDEKTSQELLKAFINDDKSFNTFYKAFLHTFKDKRPTFNIISFFVSFIYFGYRRMYLEGFLIAMISFILPLIAKYSNLGMFLSFGMSVFCGLFFFKLYFERFFRILEKINYKEKPIDEVKEVLKSRGGTDNFVYVIFGLMVLQSFLLANQSVIENAS